MKFSNFLGGIASPNYTIDVQLDADDVSLMNNAKARTRNEKDFEGEFSYHDLNSENANMQDLELEDLQASNYNYNNFSSAYHFFDDLREK
jgi:hypothetical protein